MQMKSEKKNPEDGAIQVYIPLWPLEGNMCGIFGILLCM